LARRYDLNGNLTGQGQFSYAYDAENRMAAVETEGGVTKTYTCIYDALDQRVPETARATYVAYRAIDA